MMLHEGAFLGLPRLFGSAGLLHFVVASSCCWYDRSVLLAAADHDAPVIFVDVNFFPKSLIALSVLSFFTFGAFPLYRILDHLSQLTRYVF